MAYQAPSTHPNSYVVTSTDWAIQVNNDKFFHGVPTAKVNRLASQTISASVWTAVAWSSKVFDTNNMFATTGTKVTCKTAGKFLVNLNAGMHNSSQGTVRGCGIRFNSTGTGVPTEAILLVPKNGATFNVNMFCGAIIAMTTGQFVEGCVFSDGSSNAVKTSTGTDKPKLSILWVSS